MEVKKFASGEGNVWKYVFHFGDAVAEAVLYRYGSFEERTVICVSVQSGCPVGCTFCGTGNRFIRNLSSGEIIAQVNHVLQDHQIKSNECNKFQIMFMSMGEPFLNYDKVRRSIIALNFRYANADLLVSTVVPRCSDNLNDFIHLSKEIPELGLQFSIHASYDGGRDVIIPFKHKLSLAEIRNYGVQWWHETGRKPYLNYCVTESMNDMDVECLYNLFPPNVFCITLSVLCSTNETMKEAGYRDLDCIRDFESKFISLGYDTGVTHAVGFSSSQFEDVEVDGARASVRVDKYYEPKLG